MQTLIADIRNHITTKYPNKTLYLVCNYSGALAFGNVDSLKYLDGIFNETAYYQQTTSNGFVSAYQGLAPAGFIRSTEARICADEELRFLERVGKPRHIRNFVVLTVSLAGSIYAAMLLHSASDMQFFCVVLAGIFSPAIIVAAFKVLTGM